MVMNPLGPLIEKASELTNISANLVAASREVGAAAVGAAFEFTKDTTKEATEKGSEAVGLAVSLGHTALDTVVDVSKAGLRIPGATADKIAELGTGLVGFGTRLLPALGDRPRKK